MNIVAIICVRPQFIKAAVVSHAFAAYGIIESLVHTGQHFDANMPDVLFEELEIPLPTHNLRVDGGTHGQNSGRMIEAIVRRQTRLGVYGDTDSTLAGALAAVKLHIPIAHVEAGLRSFNRRVPEEINRVLSDHVASLLFAPTGAAARHLADEGISSDAVQCIGDVMYDAALFYGEKAKCSSDILNRLGIEAKAYTLATIHRAKNTDVPARLAAIFDGFAGFGRDIVLPLHPRTRARLLANGLTVPGNVRLIDPVGYLDMVMLEQNANLIATDSGGVQKEAFFYRVPCVTLREETEWVELIEGGVEPPCSANVSI